MDAIDFGRDNSKSSHVNRPVNVSPPPGLQAIYAACRRIYPDQPNPLQVTAVVKYWFGGPDPLDYISMYVNNGNARHNIPAHWHYVTFGLSDLHGDGRVHECSGPDGPSGFGFELTFRLRREPGETAPPTWPAALLQALAKYVFQSGNSLCPGDHIPWRHSLDGSESRIQHMLMASDAQLDQIITPFGTVNFVQVVGVCEEELKVAQRWNGPGILNLIQSIPAAGGEWLVTDMRRGETIFDTDPSLQDKVDAGIEADGSNLSGVSGQCSWEDVSDSLNASDPVHERSTARDPAARFKPAAVATGRDDNKENSSHSPSVVAEGVAPSVARRRYSDKDRPQLSHNDSEQIRTALKKGLVAGSFKVLPPIKSDGQDDVSHRVQSQRKASLDSTTTASTLESLRTRTFNAVHITLNLETGSMLPLALRGRLKHGRHFTFKSTQNDSAVTLVPSSVVGSIATEDLPFAAHGPWLQVLLTDEFIDKMLVDLADITDTQQLTSPRMHSWDDRGLSITLLPDKA